MRKSFKPLNSVILFFVAILFAVFSYFRQQDYIKPAIAQVVGVIDGDTIVISYKGKISKLRYLGIDAPELKNPYNRFSKDEPGAREAFKANYDLVYGKTVLLKFDKVKKDKYGRLLAYVFLPDGTFVNKELVEKGLAETFFVPPNFAYKRELEKAAQNAKKSIYKK